MVKTRTRDAEKSTENFGFESAAVESEAVEAILETVTPVKSEGDAETSEKPKSDKKVEKKKYKKRTPKNKRKKSEEIKAARAEAAKAPELSGKKVIFEFTSLPRQLDDVKFNSWLCKKVKHIKIIGMRAIWNKTRPSCYVDIDAVFQESVLALHGVSYNGSLVEVKVDEVGPLKQPRTGGDKSADKDLRTIFVKGIPDDAGENDLTQLEIFAEASAIRIVKDRETGKSRGFGFAEFETVEQMDACMAQKRQAKINGKNLFLDKCADKNDQNFEEGRKERGRGRGGFGDGGGFSSRGGGDRGSRGGGDRGSRGGGDRGGRGRGGFGERASHGRVNSTVVSAKNKGSIQAYEGKKMKFADSDDE